MSNLCAYRTEKGARHEQEAPDRIPEQAFLKIRACAAIRGEFQDPYGSALTVEIVRGENWSLELDAHSPEFQLAIDCLTIVAKLRGGVEASRKA